ncbi:hypothetical protein B0H13DRAFT_1134257 [Mycena leptocephala]|nr:hypothetical protein B0H13DRAFT_1134257 [Mycena leptocephala]
MTVCSLCMLLTVTLPDSAVPDDPNEVSFHQGDFELSSRGPLRDRAYDGSVGMVPSNCHRSTPGPASTEDSQSSSIPRKAQAKYPSNADPHNTNKIRALDRLDRL